MKTFKRISFSIVIIAIILTTLSSSAFGFSLSDSELTAEGKVALLHFNPALGDVNANLTALGNLVNEAFGNGANIVVTPELSTTGYCITRQQVIDGLGFSSPYPQLNTIRDLAIKYKGYVVIAFAEVTPENEVFNVAAVFGPEGFIRTQQKRTLPLWHNSGENPFDVIPTPYGDLGVLVCADSYLPDFSRILTLKGADIIVTPANWWGLYDQEQTWQIRAKENGVWFLVANRWGYEVDSTYGYVCDMKDAPSVAISPSGEILQLYRAMDTAEPKDKILYQTTKVPKYRIGTSINLNYSVIKRSPGSYGALANDYYRRDHSYQPVPGLPTPGAIRVASLAYKPSPYSIENIEKIYSLWENQECSADIVVAPGLGITQELVRSKNTNWSESPNLIGIQNFVNEKGISLFVTTVNELSDNGIHQSLLLVQPGKRPELIQQLHDGILKKGSGKPPYTIDLLGARIGILTGHDALFPESVTSLAKSGTDLLLISSTAGTEFETNDILSMNYYWNIKYLKTLWKVRTNEGLHLAASDWTGNGMIIKNSGFSIEELAEVNKVNQIATLTLNTANVRSKYLNNYFIFDLDTLISPCNILN
ncbi:MAG: hypothetical protein N3I35_02910 [Clostridia bacterium]|nr:hypothetical protein [Clostridia bacterium]